MTEQGLLCGVWGSVGSVNVYVEENKVANKGYYLFILDCIYCLYCWLRTLFRKGKIFKTFVTVLCRSIFGLIYFQTLAGFAAQYNCLGSPTESGTLFFCHLEERY